MSSASTGEKISNFKELPTAVEVLPAIIEAFFMTVEMLPTVHRSIQVPAGESLGFFSFSKSASYMVVIGITLQMIGSLMKPRLNTMYGVATSLHKVPQYDSIFGNAPLYFLPHFPIRAWKGNILSSAN
ncbi:unnamed protein product [Malus baccata var. baccata]